MGKGIITILRSSMLFILNSANGLLHVSLSFKNSGSYMSVYVLFNYWKSWG